MSTLISFFEIILSIHLLLLVSSWCMSGYQLVNLPSLRLNLARLLLVSCVVSPIAVHCVKIEKPLISKFISLDSFQASTSQPQIKLKPALFSTSQASLILPMKNINYWQLFFILFFAMVLFRCYGLFSDLKKLRVILHSAISYRTFGRLNIKISSKCHIPFSVRLIKKAYIVLPVSLLSSSQNVKIAIAHEGQHHRNGDCLWAYFIESLRIVFFGNPGVARWNKILSDLQELSCDEAVIRKPTISAHDYGHCLFHVLQTVSQYSKSSEQELACTVGMALGGGKKDYQFLTRRIYMLSEYHSNMTRHPLKNVFFIGMAIIAPICSAYAAMGSIPTPAAKEMDIAFLDPKIQRIAADEITAAVKQYHAKSGVLAIADPKTGKIIAFAEAGEINGEKNWKSRIFVPGSTIKPFVAAAAIDAGVSSESHLYTCPSPYYVKNVKFTNSHSNVGSITLTEAMAKSVNTCFIKVAHDTGSIIFRKKFAEFGFDINSWWQSNESDDLQLATASLGETTPVTLETLTKAYAMLANKGRSYTSNSGSVLSEATANSITHMLDNAVKNGTGKQAAITGITVAGKTGTVSSINNGTHLSLFGGYVPSNSPQLAMVVVIENGYATNKDGISMTGGSLAAPVFHNVAVKSLKLMK